MHNDKEINFLRKWVGSFMVSSGWCNEDIVNVDIPSYRFK